METRNIVYKERELEIKGYEVRGDFATRDTPAIPDHFHVSAVIYKGVDVTDFFTSIDFEIISELCESGYDEFSLADEKRD